MGVTDDFDDKFFSFLIENLELFLFSSCSKDDDRRCDKDSNALDPLADLLQHGSYRNPGRRQATVILRQQSITKPMGGKNQFRELE